MAQEITLNAEELYRILVLIHDENGISILVREQTDKLMEIVRNQPIQKRYKLVAYVATEN